MLKSKICAILLFVCICSFPAELLASKESFERDIAKGILAVETGQYHEAIEAFQSALKDHSGDHAATLYLGIAYSRAGKAEGEGILKKALSLNTEDPRTHLEIGIFYYSRSQFPEAKAYFENTIRLAPGTQFAEKAKEYLAYIQQQGKQKRWSLNASAGIQYDTNVVINGSDNPLPAGISRESDWRAVFLLNGLYSIYQSERLEGTAGYHLYQSLHAKLTDFNVSQHIFDLAGTVTLSPSVYLGGTYAFEYTFFGGEGYDYAHSITPSITFQQGSGSSTVVEYRFRYTYFMNSDLYTTNSERTGSNNLVGITQNLPLTSFLTARFGYSHDANAARKDYWDYTGNKGFLGFAVYPHRILLLDLYGEYYRKDYGGIEPGFDIKRKDEYYFYSLMLTAGLSKNYSVTIGQAYIDNKSNISYYDYNRAITSIFLNARF